jgi:hypothetical protein
MTELLPEFSSSAYLTDTQLSRLKRIPSLHAPLALTGQGHGRHVYSSCSCCTCLASPRWSTTSIWRGLRNVSPSICDASKMKSSPVASMSLATIFLPHPTGPCAHAPARGYGTHEPSVPWRSAPCLGPQAWVLSSTAKWAPRSMCPASPGGYLLCVRCSERGAPSPRCSGGARHGAAHAEGDSRLARSGKEVRYRSPQRYRCREKKRGNLARHIRSVCIYQGDNR